MTVLGMRVHMLEICDIVAAMERMIDDERDRLHQIVVTGMHGVHVGHHDAGFKSVLNCADLFVPDGISLIWLGRLKGFSLRRRATGTDLMKSFLTLAARRGYRSYFLGDTPATLERLRQRLGALYPGLIWAGSNSPPFRPLSPQEDEEIVRKINEAKPDVLWVGLGLPKQERWIFEHRERVKVPVAVGVGAAFGFLGGTVQRAPEWVGNAGFEWLWRLIREPRKVWRRDLLHGPCFLLDIALESWRRDHANPPKSKSSAEK